MTRTVKLTSETLSDELLKLEREYGMPSATFFERYQAGEMGDSKAMMRWAWLCSVAVRAGELTRPVPA